MHKKSVSQNRETAAHSISDEEFSFPAMSSDETQEIFPVFNRNLLSENDAVSLRSDILIDYRDLNDVVGPFKKLCLDPYGDASSSESESETEELGRRLPAAGRCEKSSSTGTSGSAVKKWRLRELMRRSNSDGKESLGFVVKTNTKNKKNSKSEAVVCSTGTVSSSSVSGHEMLYVKSRGVKEGEKRKSYLPYRPELFVGFFGSNAGGGGSHGRKAIPPFR